MKISGVCSKSRKGTNVRSKKNNIEKLKSWLGDAGCIHIDITK